MNSPWPDDAGDREGQSHAVAQSETGNDEGQVAHAAGDQHQPQQKRHMIDAREDVHDAQLHILEKAGAGQFPDRDSRGRHFLLIPRKELLDERAGIGFNLCEGDMRGHELEECRGVQQQPIRTRSTGMSP